MSDPFIGQVQPWGINYAPRGWAMCDGQILNISQNTALFALIGTIYGGNGQTTFALPDLRSRVPIHQGTQPGGANYPIGAMGGVENVTLNLTQMPAHTHTLTGTNATAASKIPVAGSCFATSADAAVAFYAADATTQPINPQTISYYGGNTPHTNVQPYLTITWCIAVVGIFPSRN
jgi:microcystin-dependent protein